jgi:hypothetical protein
LVDEGGQTERLEPLDADKAPTEAEDEAERTDSTPVGDSQGEQQPAAPGDEESEKQPEEEGEQEGSGSAPAAEAPTESLAAEGSDGAERAAQAAGSESTQAHEATQVHEAAQEHEDTVVAPDDDGAAAAEAEGDGAGAGVHCTAGQIVRSCVLRLVQSSPLGACARVGGGSMSPRLLTRLEKGCV